MRMKGYQQSELRSNSPIITPHMSKFKGFLIEFRWYNYIERQGVAQVVQFYFKSISYLDRNRIPHLLFSTSNR